MDQQAPIPENSEDQEQTFQVEPALIDSASHVTQSQAPTPKEEQVLNLEEAAPENQPNDDSLVDVNMVHTSE
jgi:hypothetical protein